MGPPDSTSSPRVSFDEDDSRPYVRSYVDQPQFCVGDKVYLTSSGSREGPYFVATISSGKCTLCDEDGRTIRNGEEVKIEDLESD